MLSEMYHASPDGLNDAPRIGVRCSNTEQSSPGERRRLQTRAGDQFRPKESKNEFDEQRRRPSRLRILVRYPCPSNLKSWMTIRLRREPLLAIAVGGRCFQSSSYNQSENHLSFLTIAFKFGIHLGRFWSSLTGKIIAGSPALINAPSEDVTRLRN